MRCSSALCPPARTQPSGCPEPQSSGWVLLATPSQSREG